MRTNYLSPALAGLAVIGVLLGGGGAWATYAKVSGAVLAQGAVGAFGKPKTIQHLDGGIVEKIHVEPGTVVEQGAALLELDDTTILANLSIYRGRLRDFFVRKQRLLAELDDKTEISPPAEDLLAKYQLGMIAEAVIQQKSVMMARHASRKGEIAQLDERIAQFGKQIDGVEGLIASKRKQIDIYQQERSAIAKLVKLQLAARNQLLVYDRSFADLTGQIAEHEAEIGRLRNSILEVEISKQQVERSFREKVITEIDELSVKIDELTQQLVATEQQLSRTVIKSPVRGAVHEMAVYTIGGVIQAGQPVMQIIPIADRVEIEVNVDTVHVDQINLGQKAVVRFPSFNQRTTPELFGSVSKVSPSSVTDEKTGFSFYRVGISLPESELARLDGRVLVPGMPVEGVIPTAERTVLEYLLKPLTDNLTHVFREE